MTQPQGHSTSGSHERYKTSERLQWEREWDCNKKMREWLLLNELTTEEILQELEAFTYKLHYFVNYIISFNYYNRLIE